MQVMMIAAINDTGYNVMLLLHILTALVAFAPGFVNPMLGRQTTALDGLNRQAVIGYLSMNGRRIYGPALILTGLFGFGLQGMSDSVWEFSQSWLWLAALIWVAMIGLQHALLFPGEKALAAGDETAAQRVDTISMVINGLLIVVLYLMVFKPGF
jgi:uncharacterized membrane protein